MLKTVEVRVRHLRSVAVLDLGGDVTSQADAELAAAYDEAITHAPDAVLLDFSSVEYINSTGIAVLVSLLARAQREGRRMAACGLTPHYVEIFTVTRLADFIELYPDEQAALHGLAQERPAGTSSARPSGARA